MSDVPTHGANSPQPSSQNLGKNHGARGRDIEDIDRELEAYLEEKRSGKSVGYNHSVDEQLSQIREKFGARVTPTKESEKPKEVDVVRDSLYNYPARKEEKSKEQDTSEKAETSNQKEPALSHEELIRSLEEKYSSGESTNVPPKAQNSPSAEPEAPKEKAKSVSAKDLSPALVDLKESIEPLNQVRVDGILSKAALLTSEEQKSLKEVFLVRFKRNKERKELYIKTQSELEDELERSVSRTDTTPLSQKTESAESTEKQALPATESPSKAHDTPPEEKTKETKVDTDSSVKETAPPGEKTNLLERRYRNYLSKLEKKPLVLVYEPENGFVRKPVDPDDSALRLTYSLDSTTNTAVLTVYDTRGNELGVFKTPEKELGN